MERTNAISLASYVSTVLKRYHRSVPTIAAIVVAVLFGGTILFSEIRADSQILRAISAHVASLIETQDRPELQRLVKSIGDEKHSEVLVIEDGVVYASSRSLSELDQPYLAPRAIPLISKSFISFQGLLTESPVLRPSGSMLVNAKIIMVTPLYSILLWSLFVALFVLNVGLLVASRAGEKMKEAIEFALQPVENLDTAIRSLKNLKEPGNLAATGIVELDHIRDAILETHGALVNARDALAEKKAKELVTEAYRRLIHDLHNPVAALRTLIKVADLPHLTDEERAETARRIPQIAEQILNQVSAAKSNLDFESKILKEEDIRTCVTSAADQAKFASVRLGTIELESNLPGEAIIVAHDTQLLGRAVGNLVKNALDACRTRVRIVVARLSDSISIQVMDDGPGLAQEEVGLYLQGRSKSTKGDRQAYGLAAANHIVRAHGGRIIYRASELGGACFEIRI